MGDAYDNDHDLNRRNRPEALPLPKEKRARSPRSEFRSLSLSLSDGDVKELLLACKQRLERTIPDSSTVRLNNLIWRMSTLIQKNGESTDDTVRDAILPLLLEENRVLVEALRAYSKVSPSDARRI